MHGSQIVVRPRLVKLTCCHAGARQITAFRRAGIPLLVLQIGSLVHSVMVIGRSMLSLSVGHGTPSTVVSSCTLPESVSTSRADVSSAISSGIDRSRPLAQMKTRSGQFVVPGPG